MITELESKDWKEYLTLRSQLSNFHQDMTHVEFLTKYISMKGEYFVLKQNKKMVASGRLIVIPKFHDNIGWVDDVVVDSKYRRQGFGRQILEFLINLARQKGCYKVILGTRSNTTGFYESVGMKQTGSEFTLILT